MQELKPPDYQMRFRYAKLAKDRLAEDWNFYGKIIFFMALSFPLKQHCCFKGLGKSIRLVKMTLGALPFESF